jgi:hypothetical protein
MSVRLSLRMQQLGFHWTDFHEILYLMFFRTSIDKIQVSLKSLKFYMQINILFIIQIFPTEVV